MTDAPLFIEVARQHGYSAEAAGAALAALRARLDEAGASSGRLYIFRTGDGGVGAGAGGPGEAPSRRRRLLAFQSPDAALAFAQSLGLGASPRLVGLSLGQALAALVQRPAIGALHIADEGDAPPAPGTLPPGVTIERAALLELLAGVTP